MADLFTQGPADARTHLLLAHGAGASMTSPFMNSIVEHLCERGMRVSRFEFGYMKLRQSSDGRRPPPKAETLQEEYLAAATELVGQIPEGQTLVIGGKSMGGRVASLVAERLFRSRSVRGLVCLGYPFHPPGRPDRLRTAHLKSITTRTLIVQGERDPLGSFAEVASYDLSPSIRFHWVLDGDHDFKPRKRSGETHESNLVAAANAIVETVSQW